MNKMAHGTSAETNLCDNQEESDSIIESSPQMLQRANEVLSIENTLK